MNGKQPPICLPDTPAQETKPESFVWGIIKNHMHRIFSLPEPALRPDITVALEEDTIELYSI